MDSILAIDLQKVAEYENYTDAGNSSQRWSSVVHKKIVPSPEFSYLEKTWFVAKKAVLQENWAVQFFWQKKFILFDRDSVLVSFLKEDAFLRRPTFCDILVFSRSISKNSPITKALQTPATLPNAEAL